MVEVIDRSHIISFLAWVKKNLGKEWKCLSFFMKQGLLYVIRTDGTTNRPMHPVSRGVSFVFPLLRSDAIISQEEGLTINEPAYTVSVWGQELKNELERLARSYEESYPGTRIVIFVSAGVKKKKDE